MKKQPWLRNKFEATLDTFQNADSKQNKNIVLYMLAFSIILPYYINLVYTNLAFMHFKCVLIHCEYIKASQ